MTTDVSVALSHGVHILRNCKMVLIVLNEVAVMRLILHHGSSVLISNSRLSHHHLLLASHVLTFVASGLRVVLIANSDHGTIVDSVLLALIELVTLGVADEDNIVLVDAIVRAGVRSLFVASPQTGTGSVVTH